MTPLHIRDCPVFILISKDIELIGRKSVITYMKQIPRVAFFADCYDETNGVALTSRSLELYARSRNYPFLLVHATQGTSLRCEEAEDHLILPRSSLRFAVDRDLFFDLMLWRYLKRIEQRVRCFQPDIIHITGPGDVGILGAYCAYKLRVPLVASWHTNLHEFAMLRIRRLLGFFPESIGDVIAAGTERQVLSAVLRFYKIPCAIMAPNPDLVELLQQRTGKPVYLMKRGVDTVLFNPSRRRRIDNDFRLGYVGRLTPEKNVRFLVEIEQKLLQAGLHNVHFTIIGDGSERSWLMEHMNSADFTGVVKGESLASSYADFDLFVFPSKSDTFGNVILEALASGVPVVAFNQGGPRFFDEQSNAVHIARNEQDFIEWIMRMVQSPELLPGMREAARQFACSATWERVFTQLYEQVYEPFARRIETIQQNADVVETVTDVLMKLIRNPQEYLLRRWNYKSALLSALFRGGIFFATNISAGLAAAAGAMLAEFVLRGITTGFYGSITQAFRKAEPVWKSMLTAILLLPVLNHSIELLVHWMRGTPNLWASIGVSACFTALSTCFNLYAMRQGALLVDDEQQSLWSDMKRMPRIVINFVASPFKLIGSKCKNKPPESLSFCSWPCQKRKKKNGLDKSDSL